MSSTPIISGHTIFNLVSLSVAVALVVVVVVVVVVDVDDVVVLVAQDTDSSENILTVYVVAALAL